MSDDRMAPARLPKWPFYLADLLLCAVVFFVLYRLGTFEGTSEMIIVGICLGAAALAAWISIIPWLREQGANVQLADSTHLKSSLQQIQSLEKVADLIRQSNAQWQAIQDSSARTMNAAQEITDRMKLESQEFIKVMEQAHDQERAGLRLEVEKLRRMETDWIKVVVQMLDQVFALARAGERSGQQQLIEQLTQFQNVCREFSRRMGLSPFVPVIGEPFDARAHQLPEEKFTPPQDARVGDVLATGYTYQGQLLRRSLVLLANPDESPAQESSSTRAISAEEFNQGLEPSAESSPSESAAGRPEESAPADGANLSSSQVTDVTTGSDEADPATAEPQGDAVEAAETSPGGTSADRSRRTGQEELPL